MDAITFLAGRYAGRASDPVPLGAGDWSRAYAFTLDGAELVLRLGAYGEDYAKDRVMAGVAAGVLPVPRVLELGTVPLNGAGEGWYAVSERAHGGFLDDDLARSLPDLLALWDRLADLEAPVGSGFGLWTAAGDAPHRSWPDALLDLLDGPENPRTPGWRTALTGDARRLFDARAEELRRLAPRCPDLRRIVHSDLLNRNVLVADGRVTAVLDWANALCGDPLYDLAWLRFCEPSTGPAVASRLAGERDADLRMRAYELHIGLGSVAYNAFTGRADVLRWAVDRLSRV